MNQKIITTVSVCTLKDIRTWMWASSKIIENIDSKKYVLIAPGRYLKKFELVTPNLYTIVAEEEFARIVTLQKIQQAMPSGNLNRAGWYYQQLLKIAALSQFGESDSDINLIWDADTIPLQKLDFVKDGRPIYVQGQEYHLPYFETIERLIQLPKIVNFSFIAQCFPAKREWVKKFISEVEALHGKPWVDAILDCTDLHQVSGFSEYETLGTYIASRMPEEIATSSVYWERNGQSLGRLEDIASKFSGVSPYPAYVAYETWMPSPKSSLSDERANKNEEIIKSYIHGRFEEKLIYVEIFTPGGYREKTIAERINEQSKRQSVSITFTNEKHMIEIASAFTSRRCCLIQNSERIRSGIRQQFPNFGAEINHAMDRKSFESDESFSSADKVSTGRVLITFEKSGGSEKIVPSINSFCAALLGDSQVIDDGIQVDTKYILRLNCDNSVKNEFLHMINWRVVPPRIIIMHKNQADAESFEFLDAMGFNPIAYQDEIYFTEK